MSSQSKMTMYYGFVVLIAFIATDVILSGLSWPQIVLMDFLFIVVLIMGRASTHLENHWDRQDTIKKTNEAFKRE